MIALTGAKAMPFCSRSAAQAVMRSMVMGLAVATPMVMIAPIRAGTLSVVSVICKAQATPAKAPGNAVMMMNGSSQLWKFTTSNR